MPYVIGGRQVQLEQEPRNLNGPIFVPLRAVIEAMGGTASWDQASNTVSASFRGHTAEIPAGSQSITVDGEQRTLSVAPFYQDNHTWVPVEFFEAFGTPAMADAATNTVTVQA